MFEREVMIASLRREHNTLRELKGSPWAIFIKTSYVLHKVLMFVYYHVSMPNEMVLVIDDEKDLIKLLRYNLERECDGI